MADTEKCTTVEKNWGTKDKNGRVLLEIYLAIALHKMQSENFLHKRHLCVAVLIEPWKTTEQVEGLHFPLNVFAEFRKKLLPDKMSKIVWQNLNLLSTTI